MRAIQVKAFGGPEVLDLVDLPIPPPREGEALVAVQAAGINYADTHDLDDTYLEPVEVPFIPGREVVGRTPDGRRVLALIASGGYAQYSLAPEGQLFDIPDTIEAASALVLGVQGMTAYHILRTSAQLQDGETVLVHAAAGGVGTLAVQLARAWRAGRIIATASTEHKRKLAVALGAGVAIDPNVDDLTSAIRAANDGRRVDVILEMVGGRVFDASLRALARFGRLVTYGLAGREAPRPVSQPHLLSGSRAVIGFWLTPLRQPVYPRPGRAHCRAWVVLGTAPPAAGPLAILRCRTRHR